MLLSILLLVGSTIATKEIDCTCPPPSKGHSPLAADHGDAVYFGDGCFWHTQYDFYLVELDAPFNRNVTTVTSRTGYGGGTGNGPDTHMVCYSVGPDWSTPSPPGTYYGYPTGLGYSESTQIVLDKDTAMAQAQFKALVVKYFKAFVPGPDGWDRQDPGDAGRDYRNIVGIPGGANGPLYKIFIQNNVHNMSIKVGDGGLKDDSIDEGVVYVYDTVDFPFYRASTWHQFHTNDVLGRYVPPSYTQDAKNAALARNWVNMTCAEDPKAGTNIEDIRNIPPCHCDPEQQ